MSWPYVTAGYDIGPRTSLFDLVGDQYNAAGDCKPGTPHSRPEVMLTLGIIGAGAIGTALARRLAAGNHTILLSNRRGPDTLGPLVAQIGPSVVAATVEQASACRMVIVAVPWSQLPATLGRFADWDGRIVVDTTNPIEPPHFTVAELGGRTSSEVFADLAPGARVIKAFNTLTPAVLNLDPHQAGGRRVIFFSGDDAAAKLEFGDVIASSGFAGVDLGDLATGGRLQQFPGGPLPALNLIKMG
jgi:predicted dinucleotide-binding enzyme